MISWLENVRNTTQFNESEYFLLILALSLLVGAALFVLILYISRVFKSYREKRSNALRERFRKILNMIIVNETYSTSKQPITAFEYRMAELRSIIGNSDFARQVLIQQLVSIKKSLSGSSSRALTTTYLSLNLDDFSKKNLKSWLWKNKAQSIRELTEMEDAGSIPLISKFLHSRNPVLREESFMALTRLEKDDPFFFLNDYTDELTLWMRINIHHYLAKLDPRKIPSFSKWFNHKNLDVSLFAISMAKYFRQTSSGSALVALLKNPNSEIVRLAVETLGELDAFDCVEEIAALFDRAWNDENIAKRFVRCLGRIGDPDSHTHLIGRFLAHHSHDVKFEAAIALKKMNEKGEAFLISFNKENENSIESILKHISEPLLAT
jgi:HEAT repeat protein